MIGKLLDIIATAIALWVVVRIVPGIELHATYDGWTFLGIAVIFIVVNAIVGPVLRVLGLPVTCLTFGLFVLVINAVVFVITAWVSSQLGLGLYIEGFWHAVLAAIVLALVRGALNMLTGGLREPR